MTPRLYRLACLAAGIPLFALSVAISHGGALSVGRRVSIHVAGRAFDFGIVPAVLLPFGILVLAAALAPAARRAARNLLRSPAGIASSGAAALLMAVTLIPSGDSGRRMVVYLAAASSGFTLLSIGFWPLLARGERSVGAAIGGVRGLPSPVFLAGVFLLVFVPANLISYFVFEHIPHVQDSIAQMFQAHVFAGGHVSLPTPPNWEYFDYTGIVTTPRWYSQYPPGHAVWLMFGVLLGSPWLVNPLLGGATVVTLYFLGRELYGESTGRGAALLAALSPFLVFMSSEFMNHTSALLLLSVFMWGFARMARTGGRLPALVAGAALGWAAAVRPLSALAVAAPFGLYGAYLALRAPRRTIFPLALLALAALVPVAGFLAFNRGTTGGALTLGYVAKYGAGEWIGFGYSAWGPPHTPLRGVVHTLSNLNALERYLFEWPLPSLVLVLALFLSRPRAHWDYLLLASWLSLVTAYFFWWYQDLCFGPRFEFEAVGALALMSARGFERLPILLGERLRVAVSRERVKCGAGMVVGLCVVAMLGVNLGPLIRKYSDSYWRVNGGVYRAVRQQGLHHAVIFVNPNYGSAFLGNFAGGLGLDGDVIYVRNIAGAGGAIMAAYPGRGYYLADRGELTEVHSPLDLVPAQVRKWDPDWRLDPPCGSVALEPGILPSFAGKRSVLRTYARERELGCSLSRTVVLPPHEQSALELCVASDVRRDGRADEGWELRVLADGHALGRRTIASGRDQVRWQALRYDLTPYAGRTVQLRLEQDAGDGALDAGYWAYARVVSGPGGESPECATKGIAAWVTSAAKKHGRVCMGPWTAGGDLTSRGKVR